MTGVAGDAQLKCRSNTFTPVRLFFQETSIIIYQNLVLYIYAENWPVGEHINAFDKTITGTYIINVDSNGNMKAKDNPEIIDNSENPSESKIANWFTGLNDVISEFKTRATAFASVELHDIPGTSFQNFVFPGARVFTYNNTVGFS